MEASPKNKQVPAGLGQVWEEELAGAARRCSSDSLTGTFHVHWKLGR